MQENEFEKQVQQKMDELKLQPSDAVWQKIEVEIKREKRRRWIFIFLPLMLVGLLYGGYILVSSQPDVSPNPVMQDQNMKKEITAQKIKAPNDPIQNPIPVSEHKIPMAERDQGRNKKVPLKRQDEFIINNNQAISTVTKRKAPVTPVSEATEDIPETAKQNTTPQIPQQENIITDKKTMSDTATPDVSAIYSQADTTSVKTVITNENPVNQATKKNDPGKNEYPWSLGFSFSTGLSAMTKGFIFANGQKSLDPLQYSQGPSASIRNYTPSVRKPSVAFIAGFSAEKNISPKTIISTGLNYKLFTVTNRVGYDSASFFSDNTINNYHNRFHYIELPLSMKFQIGSSQKIKLFLKSGLSVSQLISSNALQFNNTTGLYYRDNSLFNKTQIGFNAGLDMVLTSNQKGSFLVGPYINYGISKIAKEGYNKYNFIFTGLRAQYFFRKK